MEPNQEYFVFISYSSLDNDWAIWLRDELEHYHLPASFNGRTDVRDNLRKVFRDRDELSAGPEWDEQVNQVLANTNNLIVICSPNAAKSDPVNKEVETFIALGKEDHIFPFIVEGDPKDSYPPALKHSKLGGDIKKDGGSNAAFIKVVSGMLKVGFPSLWERYEREKAEEERKVREQRDNLLLMQSRFLLEKIKELIIGGDSYTAMKLALIALPKNLEEPDRPYVKEVEDAFRTAYMHNDAILRGHVWDIEYICISSDNKYIITRASDNQIRVWDLFSGEEKFDLKSTNDKNGIYTFLSHNLQYIITAYLDNTVTVKSISNEEKIINLIGHRGFVYFAELSPDEKLILTVSIDNTIRIWEASTGKGITIIEGHTAQINSAHFCTEGDTIISSSDDTTIRVWDLKTGKELYCIKTDYHVKSAIYSPQNRFIASTSSFGMVSIWNTVTKQLIHKLEGSYVAFSNDCSLIGTTHNGQISIWDINNGELLCTMQDKDYPKGASESLVFCNDGRRIVSASGKNVRIWNMNNIEDGQIINEHGDRVSCVTFSRDGRYIASGSCYSGTMNQQEQEAIELGILDFDTTIRLWDIIVGKQIRVFDSKTMYPEDITSVAFSPNGQEIVSSSPIKIWNVITGQKNMEIDKFAMTGFNTTKCVCWGNLIASCDYHSITVWDSKTGCKIMHIEDQEIFINTIALSPDSKHVLSTSPDGIIRIWDVDSGILINSLIGHTKNVSSAQYSPDGNYIASASDDKTVRIWNIKTGEIKILYGHKDKCCSVAYGPDGTQIASTSYDNTIRIWDTLTGKEIRIIETNRSIFPVVVFCPNNQYVVTTYENSVRIWESHGLQFLINETLDRFKSNPLTPEERKKYYLD